MYTPKKLAIPLLDIHYGLVCTYTHKNMYRCVFTTEFFKKTGYSQNVYQQENEKK